MTVVPGTGVQPYQEQRIIEVVQRVFNSLFDLKYWPQFSAWYSWTLDGVAGVVSDDISSILTRHQDLAGVWYDQALDPLPALPNTGNPYTLTNTTPLFIELFNDPKIFRIWPLASTGTIRVYVRTYPAVFTINTTAAQVNFDSQALIYGAVFNLLDDDGTNPAAAERYRGLYEQRAEQLTTNLDQLPHSAKGIRGRGQSIPTNWYSD
jgi:hypothetical protein